MNSKMVLKSKLSASFAKSRKIVSPTREEESSEGKKAPHNGIVKFICASNGQFLPHKEHDTIIDIGRRDITINVMKIVCSLFSSSPTDFRVSSPLLLRSSFLWPHRRSI